MQCDSQTLTVEPVCSAMPGQSAGIAWATAPGVDCDAGFRIEHACAAVTTCMNARTATSNAATDRRLCRTMELPIDAVRNRRLKHAPKFSSCPGEAADLGQEAHPGQFAVCQIEVFSQRFWSDSMEEVGPISCRANFSHSFQPRSPWLVPLWGRHLR